jgi:hypothetical protein
LVISAVHVSLPIIRLVSGNTRFGINFYLTVKQIDDPVAGNV